MITTIFDMECYNSLRIVRGSDIHVLPDLHVAIESPFSRVPLYLEASMRRYLNVIKYRRVIDFNNKNLLRELFTRESEVLTLVDWHGDPFLVGFGIILLLPGEVACNISVTGKGRYFPLKENNARVFLGSMTRDKGWQARNPVLHAFIKKEVLNPLQRIMLKDPRASIEIKIGDHDDMFTRGIPRHADPTPGETREFLASMIKKVEENGVDMEF